ncbi:DNA-3-methyladenine glycosylase [soil metagenome]
MFTDPVMNKLVEKHGDILWNKSFDLFYDLVESIISQQLSVKASATIFQRFKDIFGNPDKVGTQTFPTPKQILKTPDKKIRAAGLSNAKVKYVKSLAEFVETKQLILKNLKKLNDEEVIVELTKVKGIGRWTAEMILIFSLQRPDVFSIGDLGLRKSISILYKVDINNLKKIEKISNKWTPNRSLASRYLWKNLDNV